MSIPIPAGMEQAPVTWTLGHTTGTEALRGARGLVRFEPTAVAVAYPDMTVLPSPITARVLGGVMDPIDLTVNDPELWNWRVTPELGPAWPAFHIDVPVEGVDLATAVVVPGIGPIRAVTGPPGTTAWDDLTGKPATYPPATHTHPITDVNGLQAIIDRLSVGTGWRDVTADFASGLSPENTGRVLIQKTGSKVLMNWDGVLLSQGAGTVSWSSALKSGWQPHNRITSWSLTRWNSLSRSQVISIHGAALYWLSEVSAGSTLSSTTTRPDVRVQGQIEYDSPGWPTSLPGTPA